MTSFFLIKKGKFLLDESAKVGNIITTDYVNIPEWPNILRKSNYWIDHPPCQNPTFTPPPPPKKKEKENEKMKRKKENRMCASY